MAVRRITDLLTKNDFMKDLNIDGLTLDEVWEEITQSANEHNRIISRRNSIRFKCIERIKGKTFVMHLKQFLQDHECLDIMGFMNEFNFVRKAPKGYSKTNEYGRLLTGYYYTQQSVGDSGDCFEGYIYIEIKPNRYLRAAYSC